MNECLNLFILQRERNNANDQQWNAIDNEAEPNPNRGQEPRQANRGAAREEGKSEQPKNKKKVHTIKN